MSGRCRKSILLYGDTGDGKTALIGEYAEYVYRTQGLITRLYCTDPGGLDTVAPQVSLGLIEAVDLFGHPNPWEWTDAMVRGKVWDGGKWVLDPQRNARVGVYAFDGATGNGDILMQDLARKAALGNNVGGQPPNVKFQEGEVKVAGNSPAHYGAVQVQLTMAIQASFYLEGADVIWTAAARRASDNDTTATILGPQIVGKALTSEVPRWFVYTFRVMATPADPLTKTQKRHTLYFDDHTDMTTPGAKGLGNSRIPLGTTPLEPITPASLVGAFSAIEGKRQEAEAKIRERLQGLRLPGE